MVKRTISYETSLETRRGGGARLKPDRDQATAPCGAPTAGDIRPSITTDNQSEPRSEIVGGSQADATQPGYPCDYLEGSKGEPNASRDPALAKCFAVGLGLVAVLRRAVPLRLDMLFEVDVPRAIGD